MAKTYTKGRLMKFQNILQILFILLAKRKATAKSLAQKFELSERSIYRYVDELSVAGVPVEIERGRYGGIVIPDTYKLPVNFMSEKEYDATLEAMTAMREQFPNSALDSAIEKITALVKSLKKDMTVSGNILIDSGTWGNNGNFAEKLKNIQLAIEESVLVNIDYLSRKREYTSRIVEPHLLVLKQNVWYVYAYCHKRNEFRLFKVARIKDIHLTGEIFKKRKFSREDIPLSFWQDENNLVEVRFELDECALPAMEEWLGADCVKEENGKNIACATLPNDDILITKILGVGCGVKVVSPEEIRQKVTIQAKKIANIYE